MAATKTIRELANERFIERGGSNMSKEQLAAIFWASVKMCESIPVKIMDGAIEDLLGEVYDDASE